MAAVVPQTPPPMMARPSFLPAVTPKGATSPVFSVRPSFLPEAVSSGNRTPEPAAAEPLVASSPLCASVSPPPDFTGMWRMTGYEGDIEEVMAAAGAGWAVRKLARGMKYGVGRAVQDIEQEGNRLTIRSEVGPRVTTMRFRVGGGRQETESPDGSRMLVEPEWRGSSLHMKVFDIEGRPLPTTSRIMEGTGMVIETSAASGRWVRRFFAREGPVGPLPVVLGACPGVEGATGAACGPATPPSSPAKDGEPLPTADVDTPVLDPSTARRPDFGGVWLLDRIEGDCDALMSEVGAGWALRRLAKTMKYGVGRMTQDVSCEGDDFAMVQAGGPRTIEMRFRIGVGEQQTLGLYGTPVVVEPVWVGDCLQVAMRRTDCTQLPRIDRYLAGEEMVVRSRLAGGGVVARYFVRQSPRPAVCVVRRLSRGCSRSSSPRACGDEVVTAPAATLAAEAESTASVAVAAAPDFSGRWLLESIEGDMEALLVDSGMSWAKRKLAKGMGYGVNRFCQDIRREGEDYVIVSEGGPVTTTMRFREGAGEQRTVGPDGAPIYVTPSWEGSALVVRSRSAQGGAMPAKRRYLDPPRMVIEAVTSKGVVRRIFASASPRRDLSTAAAGAGPAIVAAVAPAAALTTPQSRPDFSGRWMLRSIEGDFEAFLRDAGVPWTRRKLAQHREFYVGRLVQEISQDGDELDIASEREGRVVASRIVVGAGEQETLGFGGVPSVVRPVWELDNLVTVTIKPWVPIQRRFMEGNDMVVEAATSEGIVRQLFSRLGNDSSSTQESESDSSIAMA